jgi:hypothetical protein
MLPPVKPAFALLGALSATPTLWATLPISDAPILATSPAPAPIDSGKLVGSLSDCIASACAAEPDALKAFVVLGYGFGSQTRKLPISGKLQQIDFYTFTGPVGIIASEPDPEFVLAQGGKPKSAAIALKEICQTYPAADRTPPEDANRTAFLHARENYAGQAELIDIGAGQDELAATALTIVGDILDACADSPATAEALRGHGLVIAELPAAFVQTRLAENGHKAIQSTGGYTIGTAAGGFIFPADSEAGKMLEGIIRRDAPQVIEVE